MLKTLNACVSEPGMYGYATTRAKIQTATISRVCVVRTVSLSSHGSENLPLSISLNTVLIKRAHHRAIRMMITTATSPGMTTSAPRPKSKNNCAKEAPSFSPKRAVYGNCSRE